MPVSVSEEKQEKNLLEKAAEVVEEVVKPKRRGRPKKKSADWRGDSPSSGNQT